MTLRNLGTELCPRMRLGSITLIWNLKSKACCGSTLAHPLLKKFKRVSSVGKVVASIFWVYFSTGKTCTIVYEINHFIFKFSARSLLQGIYNSLKQLVDIHFELLTATQNGCHLVVLMNCKGEDHGPKI